MSRSLLDNTKRLRPCTCMTVFFQKPTVKSHPSDFFRHFPSISSNVGMPEYICLNLSLLTNLIRPFLWRLCLCDYLFSAFNSKCISLCRYLLKGCHNSDVSKDVRSQFSNMKRSELCAFCSRCVGDEITLSLLQN